tara:strand:- start:9659 stop:10159 length:501 start_codon:yes stop_codon:yes gene_type:complete
MADKAIGNTSVTIMPDRIKTRFAGACNYEPADATEKWYYTETAISVSGADNILPVENFVATTDDIHDADKIKWIAIKHSGFTTSAKTIETTDNIMLSHTGATPVYNGTTTTTGALIGPNEVFVCKFNGTTVADLHAAIVAMTGTNASAAGSSTVFAYIAAVIDDVA